MAFGDPLPMGTAQPLAQVPDRPLPPMAAAVKKPGMNWLGILADALSGAAGTTPYHMQGLLMQRQQDQEERRYEQRQQGQLGIEKALYDYKRLNPEDRQPTTYEQQLQSAGYSPGTPEYQARLKSHLDAGDDPMVTITLPGNRVYSGPRSGLAAALSGAGASPDASPTIEDGYSYTPGPGGRANQGNWKPAGGQTPRASGNFR